MIEKIESISKQLGDDKTISAYKPIPFWSWNDKLDKNELRHTEF